MNENDLLKQFKVINMMATMHSVLFNKYKWRYQALDLIIFASSVALLSMTFSDQAFLLKFGIGSDLVRLVVGLSSLVIFILSLFSLIVDWKGKYAQHKEAFNVIVGLKSEWRAFLAAMEDSSPGERTEFSRNSSLRIGSLVDIPETEFNKLKAVHCRKLAISKLISKNPGSSRAIVWIKVFLLSNYKLIVGDGQEDS